jgi:amidophosphoribosyltransferase
LISGPSDSDPASLPLPFPLAPDQAAGGSELSVEVDEYESKLDAFHDECGVFGVFGHPEAANLVYLGLYALQHRGQESAGIVSSNGKSLISHRGMGLVADIFNSEVLAKLEGTAAIGHNRYSTTGSTSLKNCQPLVVEYSRGGLALAHNGNLVNFQELRARLEAGGSIFQSSSDSELIIHLIANSQAPDLPTRVTEALRQVKGAYSLAVLSERTLIAVRDPFGFRPLVIGRLNNATIIASETCALDLVRAEYIREVEPGEMVVITDEGMRTYFPFTPAPRRRCIFEYVYFSRPDSLLYGRNVYQVRKLQGRALARESPIDADVWCRFRTQVTSPRSATLKSRVCRSRWAWCAATISVARLSSRANRFAISA